MKNNLKKIGKDVIDLEIKGLTKLKKSINSSFDYAVEAIANCQSKIILAGVGKSGLIASKIASTFSSKSQVSSILPFLSTWPVDIFK